MNESYGYLNFGTLIQVGTVVKIYGNLMEVVTFKRLTPITSYGRIIYDFSVELKAPNIEFIHSYHKYELEEMVERGEVVFYNVS